MKLAYSDTFISLELDDAELKARSLSFESMSCADTLSVLSEAVPDMHGFSAIELFRGADSVLIFATLSGGYFRAFAFSSLENMLGAVCELVPVPSSLFLSDGAYILVGKLSEEGLSVLREFGNEISPDRRYLLHLREQSVELIHMCALKTLKSSFHL